MANEVHRCSHILPVSSMRVLVIGFCVLMFIHESTEVSFGNYALTDVPTTYTGYHQQCGVQSRTCNLNSCPNLESFSSLELEALQQALAELQHNEAISMNPEFLISESEFDHGLFQTKCTAKSEVCGVQRTVTMHKYLQALVKRCGVCQVKNLLEGRCYVNATLASCEGNEQISCDRFYPFRSYDGSCNNLEHPFWGRRGNSLKYPFAPCYSDVVSKPALSKSGQPLPQNRMLVSDIVRFLEPSGASTGSLNMMIVFFSEVVNGDMIGRATRRTRKATEGFRGCLADGSNRSPNTSPLSFPLRVRPDDRVYGPLGVRCLNFSPQEKANDRCELKHKGDRNLGSTYLDMSILYTHEPQYDEHGKLMLKQCGASESLTLAKPATIQKLAIAGLFGQLHNYCVDRVRKCTGVRFNCATVRERCRALTIGVYQKIIYEQQLPKLFGEELYNLCDFNCNYNPFVESAVSQLYKSGPGRFQHIWIPDEMLYNSEEKAEWRPFNTFFHDHEQFDCTSTLAGVLESPIHIASYSNANANIFYTEDGVRGSCLTCIDLARNRDAGLCPLVTYKHYIEELIGEKNDSARCYNTFEDLSDMFKPEFCRLLEKHYESPTDVDVVMSILDNRRYKGSTLPKLVSQVTCLEFKRLKCTDRFFYTWNPNLGEGARHLIKALDLTALLALFSGMRDVPLDPFVVGSVRVASKDVQEYVKKLDYLFCNL